MVEAHPDRGYQAELIGGRPDSARVLFCAASAPMIGAGALACVAAHARALERKLLRRHRRPKMRAGPRVTLRELAIRFTRLHGGTPRGWFVAMLLSIGVASTASVSLAQGEPGYPRKPVKIVVGAAPGGSTDVLARMLGVHLAKIWRGPVVIENRPGAAGNLGADHVAKASADGYTLLMYNDGLAANVSLYSTLTYDPVKDLVPVATIATSAIVMGVTNDALKSVKDVIAMAKSRPGGYSYASCGVAAAHHIAGEMFKSMAQIDLVHIGYKGCGPALNDVLGARVPVFFQTLSNVIDHMKTGRIRILAVAEPVRLPDFPDLPTIAESSVPGFYVRPWYGIFAPRETPKELVIRINAAVEKAVSSPEMQASLKQLYYTLFTTTPDQFADLMRSDVARLGKVIRDAKITAD